MHGPVIQSLFSEVINSFIYPVVEMSHLQIKNYKLNDIPFKTVNNFPENIKLVERKILTKLIILIS